MDATISRENTPFTDYALIIFVRGGSGRLELDPVRARGRRDSAFVGRDHGFKWGDDTEDQPSACDRVLYNSFERERFWPVYE